VIETQQEKEACLKMADFLTVAENSLLLLTWKTWKVHCDSFYFSFDVQ